MIRIHRNHTAGIYYKNRPRPDYIIRTGAIVTTAHGWTEFQCPYCKLWEMESPELWKRRYCCHRCIRFMRAPWWYGRESEVDDYVTLPKKPAGEIESVTPDIPRYVKPLLPEMKPANICECCGKAFETARRHSKTCGKNCRKRKSRGQCK